MVAVFDDFHLPEPAMNKSSGAFSRAFMVGVMFTVLEASTNPGFLAAGLPLLLMGAIGFSRSREGRSLAAGRGAAVG